MNGFIGEFLGTFVLMATGTAIGAGIHLNKTNNSHHDDWYLIAFGWGVAVTMGVYVAGAYGSLGHLNPAITLPYAICGLFPWHQVVAYILGQMLGAFCGAVVNMIFFWPQFSRTSAKEGNTIGIFSTVPAIRSPFFNFFSEFFATFMMVLIMLNLGNFTQGLKPFVVGLVIFLIGSGLGTTTGFALNPARDWGPRIAYTIVPLPHKGSADWAYAWVPLLGPMAGGLAAAALQVMIH